MHAAPHPRRRGMLTRGLAAAAAVGAAQAACSPPTAYANVTMWPCGTTAGAAQAWKFNGTTGLGTFALVGTPYCLGTYGVNPLAGTPNAAVVPCSGSDPT